MIVPFHISGEETGTELSDDMPQITQLKGEGITFCGRRNACISPNSQIQTFLLTKVGDTHPSNTCQTTAWLASMKSPHWANLDIFPKYMPLLL
jgi:hypothetical protein